MMSQELADLLSLAKQLAQEAGDLIIEARSTDSLDLDYKAHNELVTSADIEADHIIRTGILSSYPAHGILSEESSPDYSDAATFEGPLWIIDPIDGTVNYAHNHFHSAVSIAFAINGEVQFGIVHCPFVAETFWAVRGQGAYLNDQPISPSQTELLSQSLVATGFPYRKDGIELLAQRLGRVLSECRDIRRLGAASLDACWVAMGRLDAYYESLSPWDIAAAKLIASEAGARVEHLSEPPPGMPWDLYAEDLLITTPAVLEAMYQLLTE